MTIKRGSVKPEKDFIKPNFQGAKKIGIKSPTKMGFF